VRYRQRDFPEARRRAKRLRREMTPAEIRFWDLLRTIDGFHWRRQHPLGPHVFDFAELGEKLLIEIDGGVHDLPEVAERDAAKEAWAVSQGYRVLRIPNVHVFGTGEPALAAVMYALRDRRVRSQSSTR
jgi:very-short-patch-repair endonuclease